MSRPLGARGMAWTAGLLLASWFGLAAAPSAAAQDAEPWAKGRQWLSVRFGYARSAATGAADGNVGFGFSYTRFLNHKWSYSAAAELNVLGRYGDASEVEVPWTVEITRHFKWNTPLRSYLGVGGGMYYNKVSGTGADLADISAAPHFAGGFNLPVSEGGVLGIDVRMSVVPAANQLNPVFGGEATTGESQSQAVHWGVKLNYAWVF